MQLRLVWITCLIIFSTAVALWLQNQRKNYAPLESSSSIKNESPASVLFKDIDMTINTAAGLPQYKLSAPIYKHFHAQQRGEFEQPDIIIFPENGKLVYAKAEKGEARENNSIITLLGHVEVKQPQADNDSNPYELQINTDKLVVFPKQQRASSDVEVSATRGPNTVTALGMTIDLEKEILYLHNDVQGHYTNK